MTVIRIKRSGTTGSPSELATGEFAYSYLAGDLSNGGDRLFIGTGVQTDGVSENIEVVGGKYFTEKLDHAPGTLTANSALIVDADNKIDRIFIDNLSLDGNTLSATNLNGDLVLSTNGTGVVSVQSDLELTGNVSISSHLTVGSQLTVGSHLTVGSLTVENSVIRLASNNTSDSVDIGVVGNYTQSEGNTVTDMITGIFRDSTSGEWYLFDEYVDSDIDDNIIDISSPTFSRGILNTDAVKFSETTIELTGDVVGTIDISQLGGGDGDANTATTHTINTTIQPNSVTLGADTTGAYVSDITADTATGIEVSGSGAELASITIAGVLADANGQVGVATYDATNFNVSNTGVVTVDTIDVGTY